MAKTKKNTKKEKQDEGNPNLQRTLDMIEKQYGAGAIMKMDESRHLTVSSVSSGSLSLDIALGGKGVPRGRVVEVFGPEASGKTTLALHMISEAQKEGGVAAFIDAEHALDTTWARKIGVDVSGLLVSQPETGEQALDIAELLVKSNSVDIIVVDSVAALVPEAEITGEMGDNHVGLQARLMSQAMRKLTGIMSKSKTILVFINQIRQKIGVMFGNPETTTGGNALKFYSSVRLDVRRIATLKDSGGEAYGNRTRVKVVKNKVAPPFRQTEFDILFTGGINWVGDIIDTAVNKEVISKSGAWLNYGDIKLGQGRDNAKQFMLDNPEMIDEIKNKILSQEGLLEEEKEAEAVKEEETAK
ncbi:Recombinase A [Sedimentisphaera cyanobacteriorum]|uniref:Protein RecA n=1 Tax=Sedimentisphaera cyanobacteriorum TaxID=1940790 RepID=A0A1Q2HQQ0_9BACT|nr:recombinase RecA [Sedimentisphaera cyanobacteriorum]AQQ09604.1 Recombinase A [Sedimentisphaera cyanobacteriorum]